jgi:glucose-6-phosphate 1-dehydrogenase
MTVAEELGVEGRGGFYDQAGVMRDMIQNHMFQLLALVAMEPPVSFQGEGVRNEKVKVLDAIRPMQPEQILANTVRGQYGEGVVGGKNVPAYRNEPKVPPQSKTETYAAVKLQVDNWRWAGVPFYLRSGKRMARRATEIVITFRRPPLLLFQRTPVDEIQPNKVVIRIQPDEGISLVVQAKQPGPSINLAPVKLDFSYKDFGAQVETTGYEQLLYDCMIGDPTLFHRADMVEAAWKIATPILDLWASLPARDFPNYASGSWGPAAADQLIQRDGRDWSKPE